MNPAKRKTLMLSILLVASIAAAFITYQRMDKCRADAEIAAASLAASRQAIDDIHRWKSSPGRAAATGMDSTQLTARLREAAAASGLPDAPGSEPGNPTRVANTDYSELLVFLRFEPLTLKQLTTFLYTLSKIDPTARAKTIELSPPLREVAPSPSQPLELWTADVAVGYLTYTPQKAPKPQ